MKPRHAAALALVGWLLMLPPVGQKADAPMREWRIVDRFPTLTACLAAENTVRENYLPAPESTLNNSLAASRRSWRGPHLTHDQAEQELTAARKFKLEIEAMKCIASDDPRLKEN